MKKIIYTFLVFLQLFAFSSAWAQSFVVKRIEVQGLQHLSPAVVDNYLPIKPGQTLTQNKTAEILRALYKSGFFDDISLERRGSTLVIHVVERPTIGRLKITGNNIIPTDKLTAVMKSVDVTQGSVYNPAILERIRQSLLNQYFQLGRYNAKVDVRVSPMSRNRVAIDINISEGLLAKIKRISIIGNHVFKESVLVKQLDISTYNIFTLLTQSDRYSEEKMELSVEKLRSYYLDRGYLHVEIKSAQAQVTPDHKSVYVTIVISEGEPFTISGYDVKGNYLMSREELDKIINITPGETFSRQKLLDAQKAISTNLGSRGYMYSTVAMQPHINEKNRSVSVTFDINPGTRTYVRHVTFTDNTRTNDIVLRREVQQMEASPASTVKLDESKQRLKLLPYIKDVEMSVKPVEDTADQVDVDYKVKEDNSAQASFKIGYSQQEGVVLGAGLNQPNFLGTGNNFGINLQRTRFEQFYGMNYTDPYYTVDGISRSFNFSISRVDPGNVYNLNSSYTNNEYDFGLMYGIPVGSQPGVFSRIDLGAIYENTQIRLTNSVSNQVQTFVNNHGKRFQELDLRAGFSRDSRDKAIFPTQGSLQTFYADGYAPLTKNSLSFYIFNYSGKWYQPLVGQYILLSKANLGYGNGFHGVNDFPFFRNFYAGGIDSVRGFSPFTLGPQDSLGKAYGGNMLTDGSLGLIVPNNFSDSLRTTVFMDAGNVYSSMNNRGYGGKSTNSGPIRFTVGIEADILTPFGPVELSLATPLNARRGHSNIDGDDLNAFQFTLGANF